MRRLVLLLCLIGCQKALPEKPDTIMATGNSAPAALLDIQSEPNGDASSLRRLTETEQKQLGETLIDMTKTVAEIDDWMKSRSDAVEIAKVRVLSRTTTKSIDKMNVVVAETLEALSGMPALLRLMEPVRDLLKDVNDEVTVMNELVQGPLGPAERAEVRLIWEEINNKTILMGRALDEAEAGLKHAREQIRE